jgi:hypothetical protein
MDIKKALIYSAVMCLALFVLFRNFDDRLPGLIGCDVAQTG